MATLITRSSSEAGLQGSSEERIQIAPDGTYWLLVVASRSALFFRSSDGGATWAYAAGSDVYFDMREALPSWVIDETGNAYVSWADHWHDPQVIKVARGRPVKGGGWKWTHLTVAPAEGRLSRESVLRVFRQGAGWMLWVAWSTYTNGSSTRVSQISVSATGTMKVVKTIHGPTNASQSHPFGSLNFAHVGDGRTPSATPHLFLMTGTRHNPGEVRMRRAQYESGNWIWGSAHTVASNVELSPSSMDSIWDGQRLCGAWIPLAETAIHFAEWTGTGSSTRRDLPAFPAGFTGAKGVSISHDPATDDLYLATYDRVNGDVIMSKLTRATNTWGAWSTVATRNGDDDVDGKIQLVRHAPSDSIDLAYANPVGSGEYDILYQRVASLTRKPAAPVLEFPASGQRLDLAAGARFTWRYQPVSAADAQQAWQFRRVWTTDGVTTTEFWNAAAQAWQTTAIWNTTDPDEPEQATFGPGKWTTGTTYTWSVRTRSSTNAESDWSASRTVIATVAAVVTVTAPYGIAYGASTPLVQWSVASLLGQRDYEIRIVAMGGGEIDPTNPGPAVWTSGTVASAVARSHRVETPLVDGQAYRAYVRVTATDGVSSAWAYSDFVLSLDPPAGPVVEVYDEIAYETDVPRARLTLIARSNFLDADQAVGTAGWESGAPNLFSAAITNGTGGWGLAPGDTFVYDTTQVYLGRTSVRFDVPANTAVTAYATEPTSVSAGTEVVVGTWFKAPAGTIVFIAHRADRAEGGYYSEGEGSVTVTATGDWQWIEAAPHAYPVATKRGVVIYYDPGPAVSFYVNGAYQWATGADQPAEVATQAADLVELTEPGLRITSIKSGLASAVSVLGDPPEAAPGQPQPLGPLTFPVLPNVEYTALASFKRELDNRAARVVIRWYDAEDGTGALIGESVGEQVVVGTATYTQAFVSERAPSAAKLGRVVLQVLGAVAGGEITYVTRISAHPGLSRAWQSGGYSATQVLRLERYDSVSSTWNTIAERIKPDLRQRVVTYDRTMPFNQDVSYRAYTDVDTGAGSVLSSGSSPVAVTHVESALWALRDELDALGEINAIVTGYRYSDEEAATVTRPAGRKYPVVDTEGPQSSEGVMTLFVPGPAAVATADLLGRPTPLFVQTPAGVVRRVRLLRRDWTPEAVRARSVDADFVEVE